MSSPIFLDLGTFYLIASFYIEVILCSFNPVFYISNLTFSRNYLGRIVCEKQCGQFCYTGVANSLK